MDGKVNVTVNVGKDADITITCEDKESILEAMVNHGLAYPADCGGRGTCGKCRIQVLDGNNYITVQDRMIFTAQELSLGYRLACQAHPTEDSKIHLLSKAETNYDTVTDSRLGVKKLSKDDPTTADKSMKNSGSNQGKDKSHRMDAKKDRYAVAIDLGTTTIAISLINTTNNEILRTLTVVNPQRMYGADVISRIKASNEGKRELLRDMIQRTLFDRIDAIGKDEGISLNDIGRIAIAGNTTMLHLLMGYSCETLGVYPFTPVHLMPIEVAFHEVFPFFNHSENAAEGIRPIPVLLLPGLSTFVGGDIVAGMLVCGFDHLEKPCLLIDLGTNGEMAIGNKHRIMLTSTAAGPAFEGGNLSCGVGSIPGAICHVNIHEGITQYKTIGDQPPIGICGTGIIDLAAELLKSNGMDETGLLTEKYFNDGYTITDQCIAEYTGKPDNSSDAKGKAIVVMQKDIRELQLAKAAIRAGVEILMKRYGISYDEIGTVYLAGGFGYKMDIDNAAYINLLPPELIGRIEAVGNTSLAGAVTCLTDGAAMERMEYIRAISEEIHLSNDDEFQDLYINHINFR